MDPGSIDSSTAAPQLGHTSEMTQSRADVAESSYQTASDGQLLPPADFRPFFTLVEDDAKGEHSHPDVHYFFSDDDPDGLTTVILDAVHEQSDPDHRLLLVDIGKDGRTVTSAHSLNSDWQISNVSTEPAPSWTAAGPTTAQEGLMLKIHGQEAQKPTIQGRRASKSEDPVQRMEAEIEAYTDRLAQLQQVLASKDVQL